MVWARSLRIVLASFGAFYFLLFVFFSFSSPGQHVRVPRTKNASQGYGGSLLSQQASTQHAQHSTREDEANMTEPAGKTKEETHTALQSYLQLLAALLTGAFNSLACLLLLAPPITLWLAWKHPYIVLPPAVAYYFLR